LLQSAPLASRRTIADKRLFFEQPVEKRHDTTYQQACGKRKVKVKPFTLYEDVSRQSAQMQFLQ
jgi:hypothetical protein